MTNQPTVTNLLHRRHRVVHFDEHVDQLLDVAEVGAVRRRRRLEVRRDVGRVVGVGNEAASRPGVVARTLIRQLQC